MSAPDTPMCHIKNNIDSLYKLSQIEQNFSNKQSLTQRHIPIYIKDDSGYVPIKLQPSHNENNVCIHINNNITCISSKTCPSSAKKRNVPIQSTCTLPIREDKASSTSRINNNKNYIPFIIKKELKTSISAAQMKNRMHVGNVYDGNNQFHYNNIKVVNVKTDDSKFKKTRIRLVNIAKHTHYYNKNNQIDKINNNNFNINSTIMKGLLLNRNQSLNNNTFFNNEKIKNVPHLHNNNSHSKNIRVHSLNFSNGTTINFPNIEESKHSTRNNINIIPKQGNTIHIYHKYKYMNNILKIHKNDKEYIRMMKEKYLHFLNEKSEINKKVSPICNGWIFDAIKHYRRKNYDPNDI